MEEPFLFLIKLAWSCRYRLPLLIAVGFMILDIRMQLEIHVQMRTRARPQRTLPFHNERPPNGESAHSNSDDSWSTFDEEELEEDIQPEEEEILAR